MAPDIATSLSIVVVGGPMGADRIVLEVGESVALSAVATNPLGLAVPAGIVDWSSSDPSVAEVDASGEVTAVAAGTAEIRAVAGEAVSSIPTTVNDTAAFAATGA